MDASAVLGIIATLSTLGFAINFGIATVAPTAWGIISGTRQLEVLTKPFFRIISRFASMRWVVTYFVLGIVYLVCAFLSVLYVLIPYPNFLTLSLYLLLFAILGSIIASILVIVKSWLLSTGELKKIMEYADVSRPHQDTSQT